jgi:hypothetical protein
MVLPINMKTILIFMYAEIMMNLILLFVMTTSYLMVLSGNCRSSSWVPSSDVGPTLPTR